jgi:hypothetical protein
MNIMKILYEYTIRCMTWDFLQCYDDETTASSEWYAKEGQCKNF